MCPGHRGHDHLNGEHAKEDERGELVVGREVRAERAEVRLLEQRCGLLLDEGRVGLGRLGEHVARRLAEVVDGVALGEPLLGEADGNEPEVGQALVLLAVCAGAVGPGVSRRSWGEGNV